MLTTVLLVDNDPELAAAQAAALRGGGFEALTAGSTEQAAELLTAHPEVSLVLLDPETVSAAEGVTAAAERLGGGELPLAFLTDGESAERTGQFEGMEQYGLVPKRCSSSVYLQLVRHAYHLYRRCRETREREQRASEVIRHIDSAVLRIDLQGQITFFNEAAERIFGYAAEEVLGRRVTETILPRYDSSGRDLEHMYEELLSSPEKYSYIENENLRRDGTRIWMAWRNNKIYDGRGELQYIQSIANDITKRKQAERDLKERERELSAIFYHTPALIILLDTDYRVRRVNTQTKELTGSAAEELTGKRYGDALQCIYHLDDPRGCSYGPDCSRCTVRALVADTIEHGVSYDRREADLPLETEEGVQKLTFLVSTVMISREEEQFCLLVLVDITERKRSEQFREDIERITRHDLKTPLNGILGAVQLLRMEESLSDEQHEYVQMIEQSGKRMLTLINQSLNLYRMEQGIYELSPEQVELDALLQDIIREFSSELISENLRLHLRHDPPPEQIDGGYLVRGEYFLCYSLFTNLLKNAVEASAEDDHLRINLSLRDDGQVAVSIWNRQPIPEEIREQFGSKYATAGKKRGTGLGIYSAILMAETQGGSLTWHSSPEEGTTVTVILPAGRTAERSGGPAESTAGG